MAQGDQDAVIPRDLLDRTWDYLTGPSGADCTATRYPNGHNLTVQGVRELAGWLSRVLPDPGGPGSDPVGPVTGG